MRSTDLLIRAIAATVTLGVLTACGGPAAAPAQATTAAPARSAAIEPTLSIAPAATAAPEANPSAAASPTPAARTTLGCGPAAIAPAGASYCFLIPDGFTDVTSTSKVTVTGTASTTTTVVAPAGNPSPDDAIAVIEYGLPVDADTLDDAALRSAFGSTMSLVAGNTGTSIMPANPAIVLSDGARTLVYDQTGPDYTATLYFVFRGKTELQIGCQYVQDQAGIEKGCAALRQSVQLISP